MGQIKQIHSLQENRGFSASNVPTGAVFLLFTGTTAVHDDAASTKSVLSMTSFICRVTSASLNPLCVP
jgi:hypothetical protein